MLESLIDGQQNKYIKHRTDVKENVKKKTQSKIITNHFPFKTHASIERIVCLGKYKLQELE